MVDYRAVMFDLDGTLLDTVQDLACATNTALRRFGCPPHPEESYCRFLGDGVRNLFRRALPPGRDSEEEIARIVPVMKALYAERWRLHTGPYPGIPELLDAIAGRGLRLAICSNKPDASAREMVEYLLPHWKWDAVVGQRDGVPIKPDPAGPMSIANQLGLAPRHFLYAGDTNTDMLTAHNCGFYAVGCLWGWRDRRELEEAGADTIIARPSELLELL